MFSYFIHSYISYLTTNQSLASGMGYNLGENKPSVSQWFDARIEKYFHTFIFLEYFYISWVSTAYVWEEGTLPHKEWLSVGNRASQVALAVKNLPANAGNIRDVGPIPGSERSPGEGHGNPLQYSCLGNPMDRGAWRAIAHKVAKSWIQVKWQPPQT